MIFVMSVTALVMTVVKRKLIAVYKGFFDIPAGMATDQRDPREYCVSIK